MIKIHEQKLKLICGSKKLKLICGSKKLKLICGSEIIKIDLWIKKNEICELE